MTPRAKILDVCRQHEWQAGGGRTLGTVLMLRKDNLRYVWVEFDERGNPVRAVVAGRVWTGMDLYDRVIAELAR